MRQSDIRRWSGHDAHLRPRKWAPAVLITPCNALEGLAPAINDQINPDGLLTDVISVPCRRR
jgi:hypothetical protein